MSHFLDCPFQSVSILNESPLMVTVGNLVVLVCRVSGMAVEWCKNDADCHVSSLNKNQESFFVVPTRTQHTTVYTCKVTDHVGNVNCTKSASITVIVVRN